MTAPIAPNKYAEMDLLRNNHIVGSDRSFNDSLIDAHLTLDRPLDGAAILAMRSHLLELDLSGCG